MDDLAPVLRYLADVSRPAPRRDGFDVRAPGADPVWLGWAAASFVAGPADAGAPPPVRSGALAPLVATDLLHAEEQVLRAGWLWLVGHALVDGIRRRVCLPMLSRAVRLTAATGGSTWWQPDWLGDLELAEVLAPDPRTRRAFEADSWQGNGRNDGPDLGELDGLDGWASDVLAAVGLPRPRVVIPSGADPWHLVRRGELAVVPGVAVWRSRPDVPSGDPAALLDLAGTDQSGTAATALYRSVEVPTGETPPDVAAVRSPLPLGAAQFDAVRRSRTTAITVVTCPPGTGASEVAAAAAVDALGRGERVLVATATGHAADAVTELLGRCGAPEPLRFDRPGSRREAAEHLAEPSVPTDVEGDLVAQAEHELAAAEEASAAAVGAIRRVLEHDAAFEAGLAGRVVLATVTAEAPGVLDGGVDLARAQQLYERARAGGRLRGRWRARRARRRLRSLVRATPTATLDDIGAALRAAREEAAVRAALEMPAADPGPEWDAVVSAEAQRRLAAGRLVDRRVRTQSVRRRRDDPAAAGAVAASLLAGAGRRAELSAELDPATLLGLFPLWLGSVGEIAASLPATPGMFDLVVLCDASRIDQPAGLPALGRARRAMLLGDAHQLRHVPSVGDADMTAARTAAGIHDGELARVLDVRRNSVFDVAVAGGRDPVLLDEHVHGAGHLVGFSNERFYGGRLRAMTRRPRAAHDHVVVARQVTGGRDDDGVNRAEIEVLPELVRALAGRHGTVGIVTPFGAHADAIEAAMMAAFDIDEVASIGLRVGTVHAFHGAERDAVIMSLAMGPDELVGHSLQFVQEDDLFNVMVTRARRHVTVLHSFDAAHLPEGMLADYLQWAGSSGGSAAAAEAVPSGWTAELLHALRSLDVPVVVNHAVGPWSVDLVVGEGDAAIAVFTGVHPDGPDAHIRRRLELGRAGWEMVDMAPSRWITRPGAAAEALAGRLARRPPVA